MLSWLFKIIPGILWLDFLDDLTDKCHTFLGFRLPCTLLILFVWMSFVGELRVRVVEGIEYVKVVYYKPNKAEILRLIGKWHVRLGACFVVCSISYYFTFEFEDDFPYLQELKEAIQNDEHNEAIEDAEKQEVFLMAHVFIQRFLQQAEAIVWIMGTLLRLKRKRFLKLAGLVVLLKPAGSFLVAFCGNYALWMLIGHGILRGFDLAPEGHPKMGSAGVFAAVVASTFYWRKFGTAEILVAVGAAVAAEIVVMKAFQKAKDEKAKKEEKEKPGLMDRAYVHAVDLVTADSDVGKTAEEQVEEIPYSRPSLYAWLAIVVYWGAVGIQIDGYDITTI